MKSILRFWTLATVALSACHHEPASTVVIDTKWDDRYELIACSNQSICVNALEQQVNEYKAVFFAEVASSPSCANVTVVNNMGQPTPDTTDKWSLSIVMDQGPTTPRWEMTQKAGIKMGGADAPKQAAEKVCAIAKAQGGKIKASN